MAIKLSKLERLRINDNSTLIEKIATADIINSVDDRGGDQLCLWKRPLAEVESRGLDYQIQVMTFKVSSNRELQELRDIVNRLKNSDPPTNA